MVWLLRHIFESSFFFFPFFCLWRQQHTLPLLAVDGCHFYFALGHSTLQDPGLVPGYAVGDHFHLFSRLLKENGFFFFSGVCVVRTVLRCFEDICSSENNRKPRKEYLFVCPFLRQKLFYAGL